MQRVPGALRLGCVLPAEIVLLCIMFSKDSYNIHFKGIVIIDMSSERICFPQSQTIIQVLNVITALLLGSHFHACVKQLFSLIVSHISSWNIFAMICSYTNESPVIRGWIFVPFTVWGIWVPNFQFNLMTVYSYLWSFPFLLFSLCKKDCRNHLKVRIKELNKSNPEILVTCRKWKALLPQLFLIKTFIKKTSLWMRASLSLKKKQHTWNKLFISAGAPFSAFCHISDEVTLNFFLPAWVSLRSTEPVHLLCHLNTAVFKTITFSSHRCVSPTLIELHLLWNSQ